ncbi:unnamed protein product [Urochloa humidicola]
MGALAGDDSDPLSAVPYPCSDDPCAALDQGPNGNTFVNDGSTGSDTMMIDEQQIVRQVRSLKGRWWPNSGPINADVDNFKLLRSLLFEVCYG